MLSIIICTYNRENMH